MKAKKTVFFVIAFIFLYLFFVYDINFHGPDEPIYYAYTASIVDDGDFNIINQINLNQSNSYISKTNNLPDFHSYGAVVLWAPFYAYAKFAYFLADKLDLKSFIAWDFGK
ncbi:MAG: hypothetical protein PHW54_07050, partial [Candidatus Omnitrophica bacterium]|nr:hypothetical protein [Candidatus Omnitrophota bacterium]